MLRHRTAAGPHPSSSAWAEFSYTISATSMAARGICTDNHWLSWIHRGGLRLSWSLPLLEICLAFTCSGDYKLWTVCSYEVWALPLSPSPRIGVFFSGTGLHRAWALPFPFVCVFVSYSIADFVVAASKSPGRKLLIDWARLS